MSEKLNRHFFLTLLLSLMMIINLLIAIMYFTKSEYLHQQIPSMPIWLIQLMAFFMIMNVVCSLALWNWKRWGFWGFCTIAVIACIINIIYNVASVPHAIITAVSGPLILFWALHMGKENKAWPRLS